MVKVDRSVCLQEAAETAGLVKIMRGAFDKLVPVRRVLVDRLVKVIGVILQEPHGLCESDFHTLTQRAWHALTAEPRLEKNSIAKQRTLYMSSFVPRVITKNSFTPTYSTVRYRNVLYV